MAKYEVRPCEHHDGTWGAVVVCKRRTTFKTSGRVGWRKEGMFDIKGGPFASRSEAIAAAHAFIAKQPDAR